MFYYMESPSFDAYFNLALEQHVFDAFPKEHSYFMLWRNRNAIIVGKHQNVAAEINQEYVKSENIAVVRRLSGGGAVYHDLGNINFTFIEAAANPEKLDFSVYCKPLLKLLQRMGVPAELSGRNDMVVDGKKFSGNSQYIKNGRVMHHGTILFDSKLDQLSRLLTPSGDKMISKGISSVRSRVTNLKPFLDEGMTVEGFVAQLRASFMEQFDMRQLALSHEDLLAVRRLEQSVYRQWSWNYGRAPKYGVSKKRHIDGVGTLEIELEVGKEGRIDALAFFGDYFGSRDSRQLAQLLIGHTLEEKELQAVLDPVDLELYFSGVLQKQFLDALLL